MKEKLGEGRGKHHGFKMIKALLKKYTVFADIVASFVSYEILNWGSKGTEDGVLTWHCSLSLFLKAFQYQRGNHIAAKQMFGIDGWWIGRLLSGIGGDDSVGHQATCHCLVLWQPAQTYRHFLPSTPSSGNPVQLHQTTVLVFLQAVLQNPNNYEMGSGRWDLIFPLTLFRSRPRL